MTTVSIVIPTLNEEENIRTVLNGILGNSELKEKVDEILIVDGQSKDTTVEVAKKFDKVRVLFDDGGKGSAVRKGLREAKGDIVVMMDADCSHTSNEIGLLIEGIKSGFDVCMGSRFIQGGGSEDITLFRRIGNKFFVLLVDIIWGMNYSDLCYGYRSFRRECIPKLKLESDGFGIETEISIKAAKAKLNVLEVPSYEKRRRAGEAKLRTFRDGFGILKRIAIELF